jgi:predicted MFS family arabinose efflux permease
MSLSPVLFFAPLYVRAALGEQRIVVLSSIVAVQALATFVAANFWGGVMDRAGRVRPFLLIGVAGHSATLLALSWLEAPRLVPAAVAACALFAGALRTGLLTSATLRRESSKGRAISEIMLIQSLGWTIASVASGILMERSGDEALRGLLFTLGLIGAFAVAAGAWFLPDTRFSEAGAVRRRFWDGVREDLSELYRSRALRAIALMAFGVSAANWIWMSVMGLFLREHLGGAHWLFGAALAGSTVVGMAAFPLAGRWTDRRGGHDVFLATVVAYMLEFAALAVVRNPVVAAAIFVIPLYPFFQVAASALVTHHSRRSQRAGGLGILTGAVALAGAAGAMLGGLIADRLGLGAVPRFSLALGILAALYGCERILRSRVLEEQVS